MKRLSISMVMVLALALTMSATVWAEDKPTATLTMKTESVGLVLGSTSGKGVLTYMGKEYPFTVSGLSILDIGGSEMEATGEVFNMKKLSDFEGSYTMAGAGATVFKGGENAFYHKQDGVYIKVSGKTTGFRANVATGGLTLKLDK